MGTRVELTVAGAWHVPLRSTLDAVAEEMRLLQRVFDRFDRDSVLCRMQRGEAAATPELVDVARLADRWHGRTRGAFDPRTAGIRELWADGTPSTASIESWRDGRSDRDLDLNGIAKGWIVDRALDAGRNVARPPAMITINAGGDVAHYGPDPISVGIEDPHRPHDNAAPLARVDLQNQALATSGTARRPGGLFDPRTGRPTAHIASASVIAPDAATADVLATALTVLHPIEGLALIGDVAGTATLIIDADGQPYRCDAWRRAER